MADRIALGRGLSARLSTLAIALALAGCAGLVPRHHPAELVPGGLPTTAAPATGAAVQAQISIDRWWTLFGDAELDRLVEQALALNQDLALAAARLREARAQSDEVRGGQRPSLDLQAANSRSRQSIDALGLPAAERTLSSHRVSLVGAYEVDLWGRLAAGSDAARSRLLAQVWSRASVEWSLTAQLAEAHFSLRALQRQLEISEAVRASREHSMSLRRTEQAAGATSEFDLRRAEAELAAAEVTIASLKRQRVGLEAALALLAGRPAATLFDAEPTRAALDPSLPFTARLPQGDAAELLRRRPDLRQAEAQLAAARADIKAARAATLPALRLSGSVGSDVRELSNLFSGPGFAWSLAANVAQSIVDGGRLQARVDQSDARADAALASYRRNVAMALTELREAYVALDITQQAQHAERQRVAALARAEGLARLGFEVGALGRLDLLDAERNHFQAQLAEVDAYRDRLIGQVAAFKALGGGHGGVGADALAGSATN
ncbi:MAG: efflux transporter outer membrane subunit [Pseudomonadota bacterium]